MSALLADDSERKKIIPPNEAAEFLAAMNIPLEDVRSAVKFAHQEALRKSSWPFPRNAAGLTRWIETVQGIRSSLVDYNSEFWTHDDYKGRPTLVGGGGKYCVGIIGGNSDTGSLEEDASPQPARKKSRPATEQSVNGQMALISVSSLTVNDPGDSHGQPWFLIYRAEKDVVKCEFSRPTGMVDGEFQDWHTRVILEPIPVGVSENEEYKGGDENVEFRIS